MRGAPPGARRRTLPRVQRRQQTFGRRVHPLSLRVLEDSGYSTDGLRSKSWEEFARPGAPAIDFVITVCDSTHEERPAFPGRPVAAHWEAPDPAAAEGSDEERRQAFADALRVQELTSLPFDSVHETALRAALQEIGER